MQMNPFNPRNFRTKPLSAAERQKRRREKLKSEGRYEEYKVKRANNQTV